MSLRMDPAALAGIADELRRSTDKLGAAELAPEADAGPSTAAISSTLVELVRAAAGLTETTSTTADDVSQASHEYVNTDASNADQLNHIRPH